MEHHHHHHQHVVPAGADGSVGIILTLSIAANLLFVVVEAVMGFVGNSLSLLSDAGHNLSDVFTLVLVAVAIKLAQAHPTERMTYGYRKSTILISLVNAIILLVAVGGIVIESIHKLMEPVAVDGAIVSITAGIGIVVNGATALLLMRRQQNDLNIRGAFLHMAADTLVSVGVVVSGIIISATGWTIIDPIVSLIIAAVILAGTWSLLADSLRLSLDGIPEGLSLSEVKTAIEADSRVREAHHLHVWAISTTENALTAHVVLESLAEMEDVKHQLKHRLSHLGITHSTIEVETPDAHCDEPQCD